MFSCLRLSFPMPRTKMVVRCFILVCALFFGATDFVKGEWTYVQGTSFMEVPVMTLWGDSTMLIGWQPNYRFIKSTNGGENWSVMALAATYETWFTGCEIVGSTIVVSSDSGIQSSTDSGRTWRYTDSGFVTRGAWALTKSGTSLLAGAVGQIYSSTNGGNSWRRADASVLPNDRVILFSTGSGALFAVTDSNRIHRSIDGGNSWDSLETTRFYRLSIAAIVSNGATVYAGTSGGVFQSDDYGTTWFQRDTMMRDWGDFSLTLLDSTLIVGSSEGGAYRSTDEGGHWQRCLGDSVPRIYVMSFVNSGNSVFASTLESAIFRSDDRGKTWQAAIGGLAGSVRGLTCEDPNCFGSWNGWPVHSSNEGATWEVVPMEDGLSSESLAYHGGKIFMAGRAGIFSFDSSKNIWIDKNSGLFSRSAHSLFSFGDRLYSGTDAGLFYSTDFGNEWISASDGECDDGIDKCVVLSMCHTDSGYVAGTVGGGVHLSSDGISWRRPASGASDHRMNCVLAIQSSVFAGTQGHGLLQSDDWGQNWYTDSLPRSSVNSLVAMGDTIFAGTEAGVFISPDRGVHWDTCGILWCGVLSLDKCDSFLLAGTTNYGLWRYPVPYTAPTLVREGAPRTFGLTCFPNPSSDVVNIVFDSRMESNATITVCDMMGREIAAPEDTHLRGGQATSLVSLQNIPAGTYVCNLRTPYANFRRMITVQH